MDKTAQADGNQQEPAKPLADGEGSKKPDTTAGDAQAKPEIKEGEAPEVKPLDISTFSDEEKKYLSGQSIENLDADAVKKLINHSLTAQRASADTTARLKQLQDAMTGKPAEPTPAPVPTDAPPTIPSGDAPQSPTAPSSQPSEGPAKIDENQVATYAMLLGTQYPDLKESFVDGSFFTDLIERGKNPTDVVSAMKLADEKLKILTLEKELAEFKKANPDAQSKANPESTKAGEFNISEANKIIVAGDKTNPKYEDALKMVKDLGLKADF
jgi:hypothetical protein